MGHRPACALHLQPPGIHGLDHQEASRADAGEDAETHKVDLGALNADDSGNVLTGEGYFDPRGHRGLVGQGRWHGRAVGRAAGPYQRGLRAQPFQRH